MTAYIGYDNILIAEDFPLNSATDELPDNPFSNTYNTNLFDTWKPGVSGDAFALFNLVGSYSVNYFAIYGHNLAGKTVSLGRWTGFSFSAVHTFVVPDNNTVFELFESKTDDFWRITIFNADIDTFVTSISVGTALELNPLRAPFSPPPLAGEVEIINNESVEHQLLGRVVRDMPFDIRIDQTLVSPEWIDQHSKPLIDHINRRPFFFTWDHERKDACVAWTEQPVSPPRYSRFLFQDFSIRAKGYR